MATEKSGKRERDAVAEGSAFVHIPSCPFAITLFAVVINAVTESASVLITLSYLHPYGHPPTWGRSKLVCFQSWCVCD
jgi:hypothetical protein